MGHNHFLFLGLSDLAWPQRIWNSHWRTLHYTRKWWRSLGNTRIHTQPRIPKAFHYGPQSRWYGRRSLIISEITSVRKDFIHEQILCYTTVALCHPREAQRGEIERLVAPVLQLVTSRYMKGNWVIKPHNDVRMKLVTNSYSISNNWFCRFP